MIGDLVMHHHLLSRQSSPSSPHVLLGTVQPISPNLANRQYLHEMLSSIKLTREYIDACTCSMWTTQSRSTSKLTRAGCPSLRKRKQSIKVRIGSWYSCIWYCHECTINYRIVDIPMPPKSLRGAITLSQYTSYRQHATLGAS